MGACSSLCVILLTLIFPPIGVFIVAGCGADLLINFALTILGYFPGHIHAFYVLYIYHDRRKQARRGNFATHRAAGVFSEKVQTGGMGYGTVHQQPINSNHNHNYNQAYY